MARKGNNSGGSRGDGPLSRNDSGLKARKKKKLSTHGVGGGGTSPIPRQSTPPAQFAPQGDSYANENRTLAVSDPLPQPPSSSFSGGGGGGGAVNPFLSGSTRANGLYQTTNTLFSAGDSYNRSPASRTLLRPSPYGSNDSLISGGGSALGMNSGGGGANSGRQAASGLVSGRNANSSGAGGGGNQVQPQYTPNRPTHPASGPPSTSLRKQMFAPAGGVSANSNNMKSLRGAQGLLPLRSTIRGGLPATPSPRSISNHNHFSNQAINTNGASTASVMRGAVAGGRGGTLDVNYIGSGGTVGSSGFIGDSPGLGGGGGSSGGGVLDDAGNNDDLFGNTQMLSTLRGFTSRRLSEDNNSAAAFSKGLIGGDGSRPFALGTTTSGKHTNNNNNISSGGSGAGAKRPKPPAQARGGDINGSGASGSSTSNILNGTGGSPGIATNQTMYPGANTNGFAMEQLQNGSGSAEVQSGSSFSRQVSQSKSSSVAAAANTSTPSSGKQQHSLPNYDFRVVVSSGKTSSRAIQLSVGSGCVQGMRPTMEDEHFAKLNHTVVRDQSVSLVAILDGHCGRSVADLGAKWIPEYFFSHDLLGDNNALALVESILQADRTIFHTLTARAKSHSSSLFGSRDFMNSADSGVNGGSTLIVAAVHGRMLYVGCLGDARAVLFDGNTTVAMSEDHKPGNPKENQRISKCGGFVQFGRVCGILAVSRALGDFEFKFSNNNHGSGSGFGGGLGTASKDTSRFVSNRELMVSNVADVRQINLTDESKFLLLACDGLWDVVSNEEATQFVKDFLMYTPDINDPLAAAGKKPKPSQGIVNRALNNCCQKLAEFAVDRGSTDNVSVTLLFFHDVIDVVASFNVSAPPTPQSQTHRSFSRRNRLAGGGVGGGAVAQRGAEMVNNVLFSNDGSRGIPNHQALSPQRGALPRVPGKQHGAYVNGGASFSPRAHGDVGSGRGSGRSQALGAEQFTGSYYLGGRSSAPETPQGPTLRVRSRPLW